MVSLGCVDAINLDGGGSSTFMTRRSGDEEITLRNTTSNSGGKTRAVAATLVVVSSAVPEEPPTVTPTGTDLSTLEVSGVSPVYVLRNETTGVCPTPVIRDGEKTLLLDGTDAVVTWENHQHFGNARVLVQGCGDYCGTIEIPYQLCPDKVRDVRIDRVASSTAALRWTAVPLAEEYVVYQYDAASNTLLELAKTSDTSMELTGLTPLTTYSLCVRARAEADGVHVDSYSYDWVYLDTLSAQSTEDLVTNIDDPSSGDDETPSEHPSDELIIPSAPQKPNPPLNPETYDLPYTGAVKGRYYYPAVVWAHIHAITNGVTATQFGPDSSCTRAQIVTFLWRAAGTPEPKTSTTAFRDVSAEAFYYKAMLWAVEEGVTKGTARDAFSPNDPCTRGQAVTFLWRLAGELQSGAENPFTDVAAGQYYTQAVLWAVQEGVTNGMTPTAFAPYGTCTRAQIVTFLYRDLA